MWYITKEQKEKLLEELKTDKSYPRIARNVGIGLSTVKRYAKQLGVRRAYGKRVEKI